MNGDVIFCLVLVQGLGCGYLAMLGGDDDLPWQSWEISRESVAFLHAVATVLAIPLFVSVVLATLAYGVWYLTKGAAFLVRDIWCHLPTRRPKEVPAKPYDRPDAFEREAAAEVEQILASEKVL